MGYFDSELDAARAEEATEEARRKAIHDAYATWLATEAKAVFGEFLEKLRATGEPTVVVHEEKRLFSRQQIKGYRIGCTPSDGYSRYPVCVTSDGVIYAGELGGVTPVGLDYICETVISHPMEGCDYAREALAPRPGDGPGRRWSEEEATEELIRYLLQYLK